MQHSLNEIVQTQIMPHVAYLYEKVLREKGDVAVGGVKCFNDFDHFVPGKIVNAFSYLLAEAEPQSPEFISFRDGLREIIHLTAQYGMDTWGIFYYLTGLQRLQRLGLLDQITTERDIEQLKLKLDWRRFVREADLTLIDLPTNYYGCAFGVARLRELLGWEDAGGSSRLFDRLMDHIEKYSGKLGYSDETPGEGRFDRYTILLPAEICTRLVDTGMPVPERLRTMLRQSCDIHLMLANETGDGMAYGRTIGAYGDTSVLEVLSIAAYLNVLTEAEKELAYAYCVRITHKFVTFWLDSGMKSINMWENGRKPDPYMQKPRILGENLSLSYQHIHSNELWNMAGYKNHLSNPDFPAQLAALPRSRFVRFTRGEYDRALAIIRDGNHVFSLPLINGGNYQYQHTPYFPIPHANRIFSGSPSEKHPNLIPRFTFTDGTVVMPLAYFKDIAFYETETEQTITYRQDEICRMGGRDPEPDGRMKVTTRYTFEPGIIRREDTYLPVEPLEVAAMEMEFASYGSGVMVAGNILRFTAGPVASIQVEGLTEVAISDIHNDERYFTPHGALQTKAVWRRENFRIEEPLRLSWTIHLTK